MHTGKIYSQAEIEQSEKLSKVTHYSDISLDDMTVDENGSCREWHTSVNQRVVYINGSALIPSEDLESALKIFSANHIKGTSSDSSALNTFKDLLLKELQTALKEQCGNNEALKQQISPNLLEFILRKTFQGGISFNGLEELCQVLANTDPPSGIDQIRLSFDFSVDNTSTDKLQIKLNVHAICRQKFIDMKLINTQQAISALLNNLGGHVLQKSLESAENLASPIKEKVITCLQQQPPQFEAALVIIETEFEKTPVVLCDSTYNISLDDQNEPQAQTSSFSYALPTNTDENQTAIFAYCEDKMRRLLLEDNIHADYALHLVSKTSNLAAKSTKEISPVLIDSLKTLLQKVGLKLIDCPQFEPQALRWIFIQSPELFNLPFFESLLNFYAQNNHFLDATVKQLINDIISKLNLNPLEHKTTLDFARSVLNKDGEFIVHHRINHTYSDNAQLADIHNYKIQITRENAPTESGPINYPDADALKKDLLDNNVSVNIADYLLSRLNQFGLLKLFNELEPKPVQTPTEVEKYAKTISYLKIIVNDDKSVTLVLNMQRKDETSKRLYDITTSIDISDKVPPKATLRAHDYKNFAPNEFHLHETFKQTATLKLLPKLQKKHLLTEHEQDIISQALLPYIKLNNNKAVLAKVTDRKIALLLAIQDPECLDHLSEENFPIFFESCFTFIAQLQNNKHPHLVKFINDNLEKYTHLPTIQKTKRSTKQFADYLTKLLGVVNKHQTASITGTTIDDLFERVYADPEQLGEEESKALNQLIMPFVQLREGRVYFTGWPQTIFPENPKARFLAMYKLAVLANLGEIKAQNYLFDVFKNTNPKQVQSIELSSLLEPQRLIAEMANNHLITLKDCYKLNPIKDQGEWDRRVTRVALRPENKALMPQLETVLKEENEKYATLQSIGKPGNILQTFIDWTVKLISFAYETDRYKELVESQRAKELIDPSPSTTDRSTANTANKGLKGINQYFENIKRKHRLSAEKSVNEMAEINTTADRSTDYTECRTKARNEEKQTAARPATAEPNKQTLVLTQ